jgi:aldose sugar dehydrogenase
MSPSRNDTKTFRWKLPVMALTAAALASGGFLLGLRSATQHDRAYFAIKELKVMAAHEVAALEEKIHPPPTNTGVLATDEIKAFTANDFSLTLLHIGAFGNTEKTAGFVNNAQGALTKFEQSAIDRLWADTGMGQVITDAQPTQHRGGGLKQTFAYKGQQLGLVSMQKVGDPSCFFASLVNFSQKKEVFRAPCLPPVEELDFSSLGGAWTATDEGILFSLGTPSDDERIASLAQDQTSPYGKVLAFTAGELQASSPADIGHFHVHSSGHRNPQGMVTLGKQVYSIDHGPKGGDEINLLEAGKNYGWPLYSFGSTYQGVPHKPHGDPAQFTEPLFAFIPSIAPSDITECPASLSARYAPMNCVLITSLRGMSLFVGLIDSQHRVVSLERIAVDMRLREFFRLPNGSLAVATDGYGAFEIGISDMPTLH